MDRLLSRGHVIGERRAGARGPPELHLGRGVEHAFERFTADIAFGQPT
jgi:hypothetical protein